MDKLIGLIVIACGFLAMLAGIAAFFAVFTMIFWNWLMPTIFGLTTIGFFQAWGLNVLSGLLFKSHTTVSKK